MGDKNNHAKRRTLNRTMTALTGKRTARALPSKPRMPWLAFLAIGSRLVAVGADAAGSTVLASRPGGEAPLPPRRAAGDDARDALAEAARGPQPRAPLLRGRGRPETRGLGSRLRHGEWHEVEYKGTGHTVLQLDLNERCATHLWVVEVGSLGARFQVRDGPDHVLGLTSQGRAGRCDRSDPDACLAHEGASSGEFVLEPGPHDVQLRVVSAPASRGSLAVKIGREMCPEASLV